MLNFCILLTFSTTEVKTKVKQVVQIAIALPFTFCFSEVFSWGLKYQGFITPSFWRSLVSEVILAGLGTLFGKKHLCGGFVFFH